MVTLSTKIQLHNMLEFQLALFVSLFITVHVTQLFQHILHTMHNIIFLCYIYMAYQRIYYIIHGLFELIFDWN
jgi:hypothetical protein